jgi:putative transferase (TIGR04331 family)
MDQLYLGQINKNYRYGEDEILGPWCFLGAEEKFPTWESLVFLEAFETPEEIAQASAECADLTAYLVGQWAERLNTQHGKTYKEIFWSRLISRWIYHTVGATWRRWNLVQRFIDKHKNNSFRASIIKDSTEIKWEFKGLEEFVNYGITTAEYDFWLYSLIIERLAPEPWELEHSHVFSPPKRPRTSTSDPLLQSNFIKRAARKLIGASPFSDVPGVGPLGALIFSMWVQILPRTERAIYFYTQVDSPPRYFPESYLQLIDLVLQKTAFQSFSNDFHTYNEKAKKLNYRSGRLFVSAASHSNEFENFRTAHATNRGERATRVQHGSNYGTMAHSHAEKLIEYNLSAFITWGWRDQNNINAHFVPLPVPHLSKIRDRHRSITKNIILVGTKTLIRSEKIDFTPDPSYWPYYRREKITFIKTLKQSLLDDFSYRPYTRSRVEFPDGNYVIKQIPSIKILDGPLEMALLSCRLLVLDHPGTTLNVAMAANVPTVCFWDPKLWPYAKEAKPYFDLLQEAGVIFSDGYSAAKRVNELGENVQDWWQSAPVQEARKAWVYQFARTSSFWWYHWLAALRRL